MERTETRIETWTIDIYTGPSPFQLSPRGNVDHPALEISRIPGPCTLLADPFILPENDGWHMFLEIKYDGNPNGMIGHAVSRNGLDWEYRQEVLKEPFHLSYPHVFRWKNEIYMVPETLGANAIRLYRAAPFPDRWIPVADLVPGSYVDSTIFRHGDHWWMFTCSEPYRHDTLHLFHAESLEGPWLPHPMNPLITNDKGGARPAGRVIFPEGNPVRFAQDCRPRYGAAVLAFDIIELTTETYKERARPQNPILAGASSHWNCYGMHHLDASRLDDGTWLASVDGRGVVAWGCKGSLPDKRYRA